MQNSLVSSGYPMLATTCFLLMGDIANQQAFDWISNDPNIIKASAIIARLMDDIVSHEVYMIVIIQELNHLCIYVKIQTNLINYKISIN